MFGIRWQGNFYFLRPVASGNFLDSLEQRDRLFLLIYSFIEVAFRHVLVLNNQFSLNEKISVYI